MPASGKSRVGRELAFALGLEHRDSDALIEETTGRKIPEIFSTDGEEYFRQLEEEVIKQALSYPGVISLGGGALRGRIALCSRGMHRRVLKSYGKHVRNIFRRLPR